MRENDKKSSTVNFIGCGFPYFDSFSGTAHQKKEKRLGISS